MRLLSSTEAKIRARYHSRSTSVTLALTARDVSPVRADARMRGRFTLATVEEIKGGVQTTWNVTVECENSDKPCCVAEWLVRYYE